MTGTGGDACSFAHDFTLAPATQVLVKCILRIGTIFYGGNFAVRADVARIGGFDTTIEFHGEDTNIGRRLYAIGRVGLFHDCYLYTSARRYVAMGKGAVISLRPELHLGDPSPPAEGHLPHRRETVMPGYEPFLLCDFHVHTTWSDGRLSVREVIDLYGQTGRFDVIAITDHILMKKDLLARAGRLATLGRRAFGVRRRLTPTSMTSALRGARCGSNMLVIPGAGSRRTGCAAKKDSSTSRSASAPINRQRHPQKSSSGRAEHRLYPHHRTDGSGSARAIVGPPRRAVGLVDVWEAGNRDDLFSVTSLKHFP
jgi:hypothetical protein